MHLHGTELVISSSIPFFKQGGDANWSRIVIPTVVFVFRNRNIFLSFWTEVLVKIKFQNASLTGVYIVDNNIYFNRAFHCRMPPKIIKQPVWLKAKFHVTLGSLLNILFCHDLRTNIYIYIYVAVLLEWNLVVSDINLGNQRQKNTNYGAVVGVSFWSKSMSQRQEH